MKTNKVKKIAFEILLLSMITSTFLTSCTDGQAENDKVGEVVNRAIPVKVQKPRMVKYSPVIYASGSLMSSEESKLSFKTTGIIKKVYASKGQEVKKGQLLAILDLSEIEAQVQQVEINLEKARRDLNRAQLLYEDTVGTLEDVQNAKTGYDMALTQYNIMQFNKKHSAIYAPSHGKILDRYFDENELITVGQPVFYFASTSKNWVIRAGLTDKEIVKIKLNDPATIRFDAIKEMEYEGYVSQVADAPDKVSKTYEVEITLKSQPEYLKAGFIGKIHIRSTKEISLNGIPASSLVGANGVSGQIFIVSKNYQAEKREISIYSILDEEVLVSAGLHGDEQVVVDGAGFVSANDLLTIR